MWIPVAIVGLLGLGGLTLVVLNWDAIVRLLKGKKVAVLGARTVGKTTLIEFLKKGSVPKTYKQTVRPENVKGRRRLRLKDLKLKIQTIRDMPGREENYGQWKTVFDDADLRFYLFRVDWIMEGKRSHEDRVRQDMSQIEQWWQEHRASSSPQDRRLPLVLVGTHGDLAKPDLTKVPDNERGDREDDIRKLPIIRDCLLAAGGEERARVVFGSLATKEDAEVLVFRILTELQPPP